MTLSGTQRAIGKGLIPALAACLVLAGASCSDERNQGGAGPEGRPPPVAVEVAPVRTADLTDGIEVAGIVREVFVQDWVPVRKGAPLARIDTREHETIVRKAEAAVEAARATLLQTQAAARDRPDDAARHAPGNGRAQRETSPLAFPDG